MALIAVISTPGLWSQEPPPSASEIERALNDLRSTDLKVVSNAAFLLGNWKVKRAVPRYWKHGRALVIGRVPSILPAVECVCG
jgi:hypothetical protein